MTLSVTSKVEFVTFECLNVDAVSAVSGALCVNAALSSSLVLVSEDERVLEREKPGNVANNWRLGKGEAGERSR